MAAAPTPAAQRLRDWPQRLEALVLERLRRPFEWGQHDCCLWAADAVHAVTGHDPAAAWRGTYASAPAAIRLLDSLGGPTALLDATMGPRVPVALAQPGDVGLVPYRGRFVHAVAVCLGGHWAAPGAQELLFFGPQQLQLAWRLTREGAPHA